MLFFQAVVQEHQGNDDVATGIASLQPSSARTESQRVWVHGVRLAGRIVRSGIYCKQPVDR